jgi:hypothetical protein
VSCAVALPWSAAGELDEPRRLALVLRQSAKALRIAEPESEPRGGVTLVSGELDEPRRLALVLRQAGFALTASAAGL